MYARVRFLRSLNIPYPLPPPRIAKRHVDVVVHAHFLMHALANARVPRAPLLRMYYAVLSTVLRCPRRINDSLVYIREKISSKSLDDIVLSLHDIILF